MHAKDKMIGAISTISNKESLGALIRSALTTNANKNNNIDANTSIFAERKSSMGYLAKNMPSTKIIK